MTTTTRPSQRPHGCWLLVARRARGRTCRNLTLGDPGTSSSPGQAAQGVVATEAGGVHGGLAVGVPGPGPEEPAQPVALGAGHDVQVGGAGRTGSRRCSSRRRCLGAQLVDHRRGEPLSGRRGRGRGARRWQLQQRKRGRAHQRRWPFKGAAGPGRPAGRARQHDRRPGRHRRRWRRTRESGSLLRSADLTSRSPVADPAPVHGTWSQGRGDRARAAADVVEVAGVAGPWVQMEPDAPRHQPLTRASAPARRPVVRVPLPPGVRHDPARRAVGSSSQALRVQRPPPAAAETSRAGRPATSRQLTGRGVLPAAIEARSRHRRAIAPCTPEACSTGAVSPGPAAREVEHCAGQRGAHRRAASTFATTSPRRT